MVIISIIIQYKQGDKGDDDRKFQFKCQKCGNTMQPSYNGIIGWLVACCFIIEERNYPNGLGKDLPLKFFKQIEENIDADTPLDDIKYIVKDAYESLGDFFEKE